MAGIGLVLGAGGVVGQAYQAGVLATLQRDCGFDARKADVIVGTSAGSITGALLRAGLPPRELEAWAAKASLSGKGKALGRALGGELPPFEPVQPGKALRRRPDLPGPDMLRRILIRPWYFRPVAASLALLAPGEMDILVQLRPLLNFLGEPWPNKDLWVCVVRRRDGRRVVFGRPGSPDAPLNLAVAASCAVPGYFAPVEIGDHAYVDGGAHSPTNAAILRPRRLDLVIIVSPMSGPARFPPTDFWSASRLHAARILRREVRALRASGTAVVVFQPGPAEQAVMGDDFMARHRLPEVAQLAAEAARKRGARPEIRRLLASLGGPCRATD